MAEFKKRSEGTKDYREKYEFRLTIGGNIICQRYFKINNFNSLSLRSYELADTVRSCAERIDHDLKEKTQIYLERCAPQVFDTVEQMNDFFLNEDNKKRMRSGFGIIVKNSPVDYFWGKDDSPVALTAKIDENELVRELTDADRTEYKFAFYIYGREICSTVWEGQYPRYIRQAIDLSNKRGRYEGEDISRLSFDQYLNYKLVEGRDDLVYGLIKELCATCSEADNSYYTTRDTYGDKTYSNVPDYSLWVYPDGTLKTNKRK